MSKTSFLFLCVVILSCLHTIAQDKIRSPKIQLQSISNVGLLNGSKGSSLALQTILGVQVKRTYAGLGLGIDYYRYRSIPVFIDLRHEFGKAKRNVFIYGDAGYNFDWLTENNKEEMFASANDDFGGGLYYDGGAGYTFGFKNSDAVLLSLGYSFKKIKRKSLAGTFCVGGPCPQEYEKYEYSLPRWVIKAGWRF